MEAKKEETGKNTAIENIFARKSVRAYTSQPIEKEKVDLLVKAAMAAPTAVNKQPWAFVVVDDRKVLDKLAAELPYAKMTAQAPLAIVVCGDLSKALNGETDRYWMLDCSAASENLLLAARCIWSTSSSIYPDTRADTVLLLIRIYCKISRYRAWNHRAYSYFLCMFRTGILRVTSNQIW